MTSIFDTSFSSNLQRLGSSTDAPRETPSTTGKKFAAVLADLEHKGAKPNENGTNQHSQVNEKPAEPPPVPTLTNLHVGELSSAGETAPPILSSLITQGTPLFTSVRLEAPAVKVSAPLTTDNPQLAVGRPLLSNPTVVPPLGEIGDKPAVPHLLGAERLQAIPAALLPEAVDANELEEGDDEAPKMPQIASIERLAVKPEALAATKAYSKKEAIKEIIATAGKYYGIDPNLSMAVAQVESAYEPKAVSKDGHNSKGIFQLLDSTGKRMLGHAGMRAERYDPFDPAQNAYLGVGYLRKLHDIFSEETNLGSNMKTVPARSAEQLEKLAVAAFNAGEGNVARAQAKARALGKNPADYSAVEPHLPASTRLYVKRVTGLKHALAREDSEETVV
ncbi:MAG: lytic transglycosylase domain-containing protein [Bdellovibrionota bacterium]